ncbi:MAG: HD domain-containing protein [Oscillibacter sp.]|nr:HD domain-containing protein [Oscillibacter sp.]
MKMPKNVQMVLSALEAAGYEAWCVGGCVRDRLMGRVPEDWDVTTSALPEETMAVFGAAALPTGLKHGTVTVKLEGTGIEVTTYRVDGDYHDHRRPERVSFTRSLEEDLRRRDFTVNAMAMDLRGKLRDPFGGQADLHNKLLRAVGEPDRRFDEDALRILRGLRFAAVLGFAIEEETGRSLLQNRALLGSIAAERIQTEFFKLLCGDHAVEVLRGYPEVIGVFWPDILPMVGFDQRNFHHCYDIWEHTLHAVSHTPKDLILRCSALLHDVGKVKCFTVDEKGVGHFYGHPKVSARMAEEMLRRLKCANDLRTAIVRLVEWHDKVFPRTEKSVRRALMNLGEQDLRRLIALKRADNLAQAPEFHGTQKEIDKFESIMEAVLQAEACFSLKDLAVNGNDLTALGLKGKAVGEALQHLLEKVVDGELPNDRHRLLEAVGTFSASGTSKEAGGVSHT